MDVSNEIYKPVYRTLLNLQVISMKTSVCLKISIILFKKLKASTSDNISIQISKHVEKQ